jgi:type II secretory pathway pseudopilin PulG
MAEAGELLGAAGILLALASIVYARSQAHAARREAEEATRAGMLEAQRAALTVYREVRVRNFDDPSWLEVFLRANPTLATEIAQAGGPERWIRHREFVENLQDSYSLRKADAVLDTTWRVGITSIRPVARMPGFREVFESMARFGALEPEFAAWLRGVLDHRDLRDPLGRVVFTGAEAPTRQAPGKV